MTLRQLQRGDDTGLGRDKIDTMPYAPELDQTAPGPGYSAEHTPAQPGLPRIPSAIDAPTADPGIDANAATFIPRSRPASVELAVSASGEQLPFQSWERYKIVSFLGAGGMGTVYKARDPKLNRYVAIKFLRSGHANVHQNRERRHFEREARAQAALEHPHICKIPEG